MVRSSTFTQTIVTLVCTVSVVLLAESILLSMGTDVPVTSLSILIWSDTVAVNPLIRHKSVVILHPGEFLEVTCSGPVPQFIVTSVFNKENVVFYTGQQRDWNGDSVNGDESKFNVSFVTEVDDRFRGWVGCKPILDFQDPHYLFTTWKHVIVMKEENLENKSMLDKLANGHWASDNKIVNQLQSSTAFNTNHKQKANYVKRKAKIKSESGYKTFWNFEEQETLRMLTTEYQGTEEKKDKEVDLSILLLPCIDFNQCVMFQHCFVQKCPDKIPEAGICIGGDCRLEFRPTFGGGMLNYTINGTSHFRFLVRDLYSQIYFTDQLTPRGAFTRLTEQKINETASIFVCEALRFTNIPHLMLGFLKNGVFEPAPNVMEMEGSQWIMRRGLTVIAGPGEMHEVTCQISEPFSKTWSTVTVEFYGPEKFNWKAWFPKFLISMTGVAIVGFAIKYLLYEWRSLLAKLQAQRRHDDGIEAKN